MKERRSPAKYHILPCVITLLALIALLTAAALRVQAIGGNPGSSDAQSFYAVWDDSSKSITFAAEPPGEGTYEEVTGVKEFIQKYKDEVKTVDFAFTNGEGQSEKIVLGHEEADTLFYECGELKEIKNLKNLDTSLCTTMRGMFAYCTSLEAIDVSGFDTSGVKDMSHMFRNCEVLEELDLSKFNTSAVTDMGFMFCRCFKLKEIDLSKFNTSAVTNMTYMFNRCYAAKNIDVTSFDTSKVTDMECMFYHCDSIKEIDVSGFDTSKVRSMYIMFAYCQELEELDLSSFTTDSISTSHDSYPGLTGLVYYCPKVKSIDVSGMKTGRGVLSLQNSFTGCYTLERITLGPEIILAPYTGGYAPCGLSGNWAREDKPDEMITTGALFELFDGTKPESAGTYIRYIPEGHFYRTDGTLNQDNMWEVHTPDERFKGYCLNKFRGGVAPYLDRVQITSDSQLRELLDSNVPEASIGYAPLGNSVEEALVTIMYYGWPSDKAGIKAKYGLTDNEFIEVTQNAIWDFVDRYDNKSGPENQSEKMIAAYNELLAQRYSNIQERYELYVYTTRDERFQNLISIRSLTDGIYGGVEVYKQNNLSEPLQGAEFTVYTMDGQAVRTMTTGSDGYASICETDSYQGLPAGDYYVRETKAPAGYVIDNIRYYFTIEEDNVIVTLGRRSVDGDDEYMIFKNADLAGYEGGGISVKKVSDTRKELIGAEFTIYDSSGGVVMNIISGEDGIASTGARDLSLGSYTIKETRAPSGYVATGETRSFEITEDKQFLEEAFEFTNNGKSGEVIIDAKKIFKNGKLKGDDFSFRLTTMDGEVLQEKTCDSEGRVVFDAIPYTAEDQGYVNYKIVEVKGDDKNIEYDTHEEIVTVTIVDTGADDLECIAIYDEDGATFTNSKEPFIEKTVNFEKGEILDNTSKEVTYTIKTLVPSDIKNFRVVDDLPSALEFGDRKSFKIKVDGEEKNLDFALGDSKFLLELKEDVIKDYYGSEIEVSFNARIRKGADLSKFKQGERYVVNNVAVCIIDLDIRIESDAEEAGIVLDEYDEGNEEEAERTERAERARRAETGDDTYIALYVIMLFAAFVPAAMILIKRRRQGR